MKKALYLLYFFLMATSITSILSVPAVIAQDIKFGAKLLLDHGDYNGVNHATGDSGSGNEIRFVRLYLINKFDEHWETMLQLQTSARDSVTKTIWKEAFLKYKGLGPFDLTLGKRKEPFGLQMLVNAERVLFMERAMISSAFAPERTLGLTVSTYPGKSSVEFGLYTQSGSGNPSYAKGGHEVNNLEKDTYALTGRVTYAPIQTDNLLLHFGLAGSYRDFGGNIFQVKDRAENHLGQQIVISGQTVADNLNLFGLEAAALYGPFTFQSEYMQLCVNASKGAQEADYNGYYAELGYFLTKGIRPYNKGVFGKVIPSSAIGAWQLMTRYSVLDANDSNGGVEAENFAVGLNWFANKSVRISANYVRTQLDNSKLSDDDGDAFLMRFQYDF